LPRSIVAHAQASEFGCRSPARLLELELLVLSGDVDRQWWMQAMPGH